MKVGDYVRTKDGRIGKIIQEEYITPCNDKHRYIYLIDVDNEMWYDEETIIKSSPNIIDLIEEGDYVNGERVDYIDDCKGAMREFYYTFEDVTHDVGHYEEEIETIVTKEQFESVKYKVGE